MSAAKHTPGPRRMTEHQLMARIQARLIDHGYPTVCGYSGWITKNAAREVRAQWVRTSKARRTTPQDFATRYVRAALSKATPGAHQ